MFFFTTGRGGEGGKKGKCVLIEIWREVGCGNVCMFVGNKKKRRKRKEPHREKNGRLGKRKKEKKEKAQRPSIQGAPQPVPPQSSNLLTHQRRNPILSLQILIQIRLTVTTTLRAANRRLARSLRDARRARRDVEDLIVDEGAGGGARRAEAPEEFVAAEGGVWGWCWLPGVVAGGGGGGPEGGEGEEDGDDGEGVGGEFGDVDDVLEDGEYCWGGRRLA